MAPADEPDCDARTELQLVADSDEELLCKVGERDREAFEILYRRYARPVFGLAIRRLRDRGRAEDVTQEAFTAIWRSAAGYDPERGAAVSWLYSVAGNAVIDHARRESRIQYSKSGESPEIVSGEPGPESAAEGSWVAFQVHAAVAQLPEGERVTLELAYWGGRSQSEIANLLDLPLGTVKSRTRSALGRLAVQLEGMR